MQTCESDVEHASTGVSARVVAAPGKILKDVYPVHITNNVNDVHRSREQVAPTSGVPTVSGGNGAEPAGSGSQVVNNDCPHCSYC